MKIALYKGVSPISRMIRFITRSSYSHAAFLFDEGATRAASRLTRRLVGKLPFWDEGSVIEAWQGGVKNSTSLSSLHTKGTVVDVFSPIIPMSDEQEENLIVFCVDIIGWPYSYWNVLKFLTKRPGRMDGSYFCSEAVFDGFQNHAGLTLLKNKQAWEVPPDWLQMPICLKKTDTVVTK